MSNLSRYSIQITFLVLLGLSFTSSVYALQLDYPDWLPLETDMSLKDLVGALFNMFLVIAGAAAFIMIVVGGFRYLTSMGNPSKMGDAKSQVFNALIGLVLLLASFLILNTIGPELVELTEPTIEEVVKAPEPEPPEPPTPPIPKVITSIDLDQAIDDTIKFLKTKNVVGTMTSFAKFAKQRDARQYCKGHNCQYQFAVEGEMVINIPAWGPCLYDGCCKPWATLPFIGLYCFQPCTDLGCPGGTEPIIIPISRSFPDPPGNCTPPFCDTGEETCPEPNAENGINKAIDKVETVVNEGLLTADKLKLALDQAKEDINECIADEGKILFPCSYAKSVQDWLGPIDCEEGRDFYCIWAEGEETKYEKITFPIEPLKQAYDAIDKLAAAADGCQCKNVNCSCSPPLPPLKAELNERITKFWCLPDLQGCHTKGDGLIPPWECGAPCEQPENSSAPFPNGFAEKKQKAKQIAGPKPEEICSDVLCPDGLRQHYTTLAGIVDETKRASTGQGLYLCEDIQAMLEYDNTETGYLWTGNPDHCPGYDIFPCCPTTPDLIQKIKECGPIDFFVCGEVTGGPVVPTTCTGICKDNPCSAYNNCSILTGACAIGYCCQGVCTEKPSGPPWPMVCDTDKIPDCDKAGVFAGFIKTSKQWSDATQALKDVIECIYTDPVKGAPINPGPISSISDPNLPDRGGTDGCDYDKCKLPPCQNPEVNCGESNDPDKCVRECGSWHYGKICTLIKPWREVAFSYAVELKDQHKISALTDTIHRCGGTTWAEKDHIAIIVHPIIGPTVEGGACPD